MKNPEGRPTIRILPDGRQVPTVKGLLKTEEEKKRLSEISTGRPKSESQVAKQSTLWLKIWPMAEREASPPEMMELTGATKSNINSALRRKRPEAFSLKRRKSSPEDEWRRRSEASSRKRKLIFSEDRHYYIEFAKRILNEGFITADSLTYWDRLLAIFATDQRDLPKDFVKKISLEFLLMGLEKLKDGNGSPLLSYMALTKEVFPQGFEKSIADEEEFVKAKFLADQGKFLPGVDEEDRDGFFLSELTRLRKEIAAGGSTEILEQLEPFYETDPTIAERLKLQIAQIVKSTQREGDQKNGSKPKGWRGDPNQREFLPTKAASSFKPIDPVYIKDR